MESAKGRMVKGGHQTSYFSQGVGLIKSYRTVSKKIITMIGIGWVVTPVLSGLLAYFILKFLGDIL